MKESTKKWLGFFCWVPLSIFTASVIYFIYNANHTPAGPHVYQDHEALVYYLNQYYDSMFAWLFCGSVIGMIVLLYFVIHLLRLKHMHPAVKALWIIFMAFTGSFGLPFFYYLELRQEPHDVPMHASIE